MQNGDGVRDGGRERAGLRSKGGGSWKWKAVRRDLIEICKNVVTKARGDKAGGWETRNGGWEKANLTETHADPATGVDSVVVESRRSWSHVKAPGIGAEVESKVG